MNKLLSAVFLLLTCINVQLFADSTFVSGTIVNQIWNASGSPYCVTGDIYVASLSIEPGVTVLFMGNYQFEIGGVIMAVGTPQDSILFTAANLVEGWQGITFSDIQPGSKLSYCTITHAKNSALRIVNSTLDIRDCRFLNNHSTSGGAMNLVLGSQKTLVLERCLFQGNTSSGHGGGIWANLSHNATTGTLMLKDCKISRNVANPSRAAGNYQGGGIYSLNGSLILENCEVSNDTCFSECYTWHCTDRAYGGGIFSQDQDVELKNCRILHNYALARDSQIGGLENNQGYGGGIYFNALNGMLTATNCIIGCNKSFSNGSHPLGQGNGIFAYSGSVIIENCTLARNGALSTHQTDALYTQSATVTILNSILYWNNPLTVNPDTYGDQISGPGTVNVTYSDIQGAAPLPGPGNIAVNPVFAAQDCGDLQIVFPSLCIDAGHPFPAYNDPEDPLNPGFAAFPSLGTIRNDMGAYGGPGASNWTDTTITAISTAEPGFAKGFSLDQNYPNPFNPTTNIRFTLPNAAHVKLTVFNLLGQQVAELRNAPTPAGEHIVAFSGKHLSSGAYYYRIEAGRFRSIRKMLLIK